MATEPLFSVPLTDFAAALLSERELVPRARIIAQQVAELIPESAVAVYIVEDQERPSWRLKAYIGEISLDSAEIPFESGILGAVGERRQILQFEAAGINREDYAHLDVRQTVGGLAYVPILVEDSLLGCIEIITFDAPLSSTVLESLMPLAECSALAIATALAYESERNAGLQSITRLTQLYDIEKVFNATLEMQALWPLICSKVQDLTDATGVNLWMVDKDDFLLVQQTGVDPTKTVGSHEVEGGTIIGEVSKDAEPLLLDADDPRLAERNRSADSPILSLMAVALMDGESLVGVLEVVSCDPDRTFDDDQLFTLAQVSGSAAQALHNASLLEAERKVEILHTLVNVSHEITSTLNLERMLQTIVNAPQAVIPYERAAIALDERGRCKLGAVTGLTQVNADAPEIAPLYDLLQWAMLSNEVIHVTQHDEDIDADREETRAKLLRYFEGTGMRGFYATPLRDDTGMVGVLALESSDPDFLSPAHLEILQVLSGQATVALRNAQMYKDVPFISVLEPVLERKRKFMALEKRRRMLMIAGVGAIVIFLVGFPWPLRVEGDAVVAPVRSAKLQPEIEGVVSKVYVREGDRVSRGQVIAELADWEPRIALSQAEAKYQSAVLQMNRALVANDGSEAGVQRVQVDYWKSEVARDQERLNQAQLRSPIDGVVATPDVETMVGRRLQHGDTLAEVVDTSRAIVDLAIDDTDVSLLRTGERASLKLNGFPTQIFRGDVTVVSPQATVVGESRVFFARVTIPNPEGSIRAGMEGRGKVRVGWYPAGYALFRRPLLWLYSKAWSWFGV